MKSSINVTALMKATQAELKAAHGIDVPLEELRSSYIAASTALLKGGETVLRTLFLVPDESGCLEHLALDKAGELSAPNFRFAEDAEARIADLVALVPNVNQYGLPEYYIDRVKWFGGRFNLSFTPHAFVHYRDLGDDSGDTVELQVGMPVAEKERFVLAVLASHSDFFDEVAQWVGQHYRVNFDALGDSGKVEWVDRYLDSRAGGDGSEANLPQVLKNESPVEKLFLEWVFPDEDSDSIRCSEVDLLTGALNLDTSPKAVVKELDRVRLVVEYDDNELQFDVIHTEGIEGGWRVTAEGLSELRQALKARL